MHFDYLRSRSDFVFLANVEIDGTQIRCGFAFFGVAMTAPVWLINPAGEQVGRLKPPKEAEAIATSITMTDTADLIIFELMEV